jgi:AraC-like DNA-binding protein
MQVHHTPAYLAAQAGMSESKLNKIFKQVTKTTLYAYLKNKRMILASALLEDPAKKLKQIARQSGYSNYSNFSRAFKTHVGVAPLVYRNTMLKKNTD